MKQVMRLLAVAAAAAAFLTGCGGSPQPLAPTSYGDAGHCWFVDDPGEVYALQQAGLCPVNWVAYPAPVWYRARYLDYFESPTYVTHYVPVSVRTTYVTHIHTWSDSHRSDITTQRRVNVGTSNRTYSAGNDRSGDRPEASQPTTSRRVSVGTSTRRFSSGSRRR